MKSLENPRERRFLWVVLILGLAVRLAVLSQTTTLGTMIMDEQHYSQIARNIVAGNGYAWGPGEPTSIRPPLYPGLLAAVWSISGPQNLQVIRGLQIVLSLITAVVVYFIGLRAFGAAVARWAAAICWLYPSLIFFDSLILTETLFTLLLMVFVLTTVLVVQTPRAGLAVACGVSLGFAALTRSILWPLPLLLCPLLVLLIRESFTKRVALAALVFAGYAVVLAPWVVRNTRLQGVLTMVDTMGGMNLRMGNYEYTPDDRMWDAVALTGEKSWTVGLPPPPPGEVMTEGRKEKWAQAKAIEYMRTHPRETVRRAFIKFADFWGLEREFIAGVQIGLFKPPFWFQVLGGLSIVLGYVIVVIAGAAGVWLAPPKDWRVHVALLVPVVLIMGLHTIVFGHSRYHVPLMPLLGLYGAALAHHVRALMPARRPVFVGALVSVTALLAVWIRQVAIVDLARISALINHAG